jgi:hypothetical protein
MTAMGSSRADVPRAGEMTASALSTGVSKSIHHRFHSAATNKRKEQANSWRLLDHGPLQSGGPDHDFNDGHDGCDNTHNGSDERCSTPKEELQPASQYEEDGPAVAGLVALPKEMQLLIAAYVILLSQPIHMDTELTLS